MNIQQQKINSIKFPKNLNIIEYKLKHISMQNTNIKNKSNPKKNNNLYIKSEYNIQKNPNEYPDLLTYMPSLPSQISKQNNKKLSNINISSPEIKLDKYDDTVSTVPLTKENIENKKPLSCEKRKIKNDMIFVKKKIQGKLKNSFIPKSNDDKPRNNSCLCIHNTINTKNVLNSFDNEQINNSVLITNNNINLITNNNYITSTMCERNMINMKHNNTDKFIVRANNSVNLRKKKDINDYFYENNSQKNNNCILPYNTNMKNLKSSQAIRYRNVINYFDNFNFFSFDNGLNNKFDINLSTFENNNKNNKQDNNPIIEKNIKVKKRVINNNINLIKNENYINNNNNNKINNSLIKEINLEDLYLILKKFEIIKNNITLLKNIKNRSNKQLLEYINMTRIFIYDLYKFYLNSSFEGCPQTLFRDKNTQLYLHFYSVILIISLGLIYAITHKIKLIKDLKNKILLLTSTLQKGFLYFCDALFKNNSEIIVNNIWINEIRNELNKMKISYDMDCVSCIKKSGIESYAIFNEILKNLFNVNLSNNIINSQELFLYQRFHNKSFIFLTQINIQNLKEIFDKNIFHIINLSNKTNQNNNISQSKKRAEITSLLFQKENIHNIAKNKIQAKIKTKTLNKIINNIKNANKTQNNYKNLIEKIKVKEPYLNFPSSKKYTLVLDLDETLISFQFISQEKGIGEMHLRPGLENFLEIIKNYYEIIIFTSGTREYADKILDVIEHKKKKKFFDGRLYREHTTCIGNKYIKDLSKIGRDLSKTLIVDNLSYSFKFQYDNGILISSFYGEENDKALIELQKILIKIYNENTDVRMSIKKFKDEIIKNVSCLDLYQYNNSDISNTVNNSNYNNVDLIL